MLALRGGSPEGLAERAAPKRGVRMFFRAVAGAASVTAAALVAAVLLVPPAQAATSPGQLTGTQLTSALLPTSYFPSGYTIEKRTAYSSGRRLEHSAAKYNLATFSCKKYLLDGLPLTGLGETATAGNFINDRGRGYQQTVWQFSSPSQAASFYQRMYAFYGRCRTVTATIGHSIGGLTTQSLKKTRVGPYPAFKADQTATLTGFPATMNDSLVTVAGTDVFVIDAVGHPAPVKPALTTAILHLITRVQALR